MATRLKINRGTTYSRTVTYQSNGVTTPITGATVYFTVKPTEYDAITTDTTAVVSKTLSNLSDSNAAAGIAVITLLPADTATIDPSIDYYYDIKIKLASGAVYKLDEGNITFDGSPTNRSGV